MFDWSAQGGRFLRFLICGCRIRSNRASRQIPLALLYIYMINAIQGDGRLSKVKRSSFWSCKHPYGQYWAGDSIPWMMLPIYASRWVTADHLGPTSVFVRQCSVSLSWFQWSVYRLPKLKDNPHKELRHLVPCLIINSACFSFRDIPVSEITFVFN